jgi:hypothetical protein
MSLYRVLYARSPDGQPLGPKTEERSVHGIALCGRIQEAWFNAESEAQALEMAATLYQGTGKVERVVAGLDPRTEAAMQRMSIR